jgi:alkylation response protein AidB-like acyl-CoA dehydrogenase
MASMPVMAVLALVASAPALGAAQSAVDLYGDRVRERVLAYTLGDKAVDQPAAQMRLGDALAQVRAAAAVHDGAVTMLLDAVHAEGLPDRAGPTVDLRMAVRLAAADTVRRSNEVISYVCAGAGASVYQRTHPLQRLQRDVEVLKGHVIFDWDRTTELAGRIELGLPMRPADRI